MKKKLIPALLITAVLTATLSGCSTKPEIPASPPTKSKENTTKDVAATKEAPTEAPTEADNTPVPTLRLNFLQILMIALSEAS